MVRYIIKRLGFSLLTLWVLITVTFFMMHALPGDPFTGQRAIPKAVMEKLNERYGLNQPIHIQYFTYLKNLVRGDFGDSLAYKGRSINGIIAKAFPYSLELGIRALIFAVIVGLLLGIVAALNHNRKWDTTTIVIAVIGVSVPGFIFGALLQYFVALKLTKFIQEIFDTSFKLFPIAGWSTPMHKLLPAFALGLGALAIVARLMRTSMLDVIGQDYIKTAKAKGLTKPSIVWKHSVRNAILPVVTILGPLTANILTGGFVVENIFHIPGLGRWFVQSVQANDYTMIAGMTVFYGSFLIIANMLVDIAYVFIDPRIKLVDRKE